MRPSKKQDLLQKALVVFYRDGFHATAMDGLVAKTGISKTAMYNHFQSKEELILAVLKLRDAQFRAWLFQRMAELADSPEGQLLALFDALGEWFMEPDFRGCLFVKALAEYQDRNHPIHLQAAGHKALLQSQLCGLATAASFPEPDHLARRLLLLKEGAIASAQLGEGPERRQVALEAKSMAANLLGSAEGSSDELSRGLSPDRNLGDGALAKGPQGTSAGRKRSPGPEALLFDLGGVLLDVDFTRAFKLWAEHAGEDPLAVQAAFAEDQAYETHERGEISANAYFAHLRGTLGLGLSNSQFLEGWNAIFVGEMPGIRGLLQKLSAQGLPLFGFSNTNKAHARCWGLLYEDLFAPFEKIYASSTIGLRKPDPAAFAHVIEETGLAPDQVAFFDDLLANVEGARASGLRAYHVPSPTDLQSAIEELGL